MLRSSTIREATGCGRRRYHRARVVFRLRVGRQRVLRQVLASNGRTIACYGFAYFEHLRCYGGSSHLDLWKLALRRTACDIRPRLSSVDAQVAHLYWIVSERLVPYSDVQLKAAVMSAHLLHALVARSASHATGLKRSSHASFAIAAEASILYLFVVGSSAARDAATDAPFWSERPCNKACQFWD